VCCSQTLASTSKLPRHEPGPANRTSQKTKYVSDMTGTDISSAHNVGIASPNTNALWINRFPKANSNTGLIFKAGKSGKRQSATRCFLVVKRYYHHVLHNSIPDGPWPAKVILERESSMSSRSRKGPCERLNPHIDPYQVRTYTPSSVGCVLQTVACVHLSL
jgi:hypothetical protein